jgi:hypothetical protein
VEILAALALAVAALALLLALVLARRLSRQQARLDRVERSAPLDESDAARVRAEVAASLSRVAVVRYDAFGDMGGRLSFSAALLDANGDGLVLTSIHGRSESRTYAKGVAAGESPDESTTLTPEERQAVAAARKGSPTA